MPDNKKIYQIQINGIDQSIKQVDALSNTLDALDKKIKTMENRTVNVSSVGTSKSSILSEDVALEKELNKLKNEEAGLNAKIAASQTEVYKSVQATKDLYKEAVNDQKQIAAQERLTADAYSNTMQGMKEKLADLKTMINTTDLAEASKISEMTTKANELSSKLKEMETAYGSFGRNVGNYQSAFDGLTKISVTVGGITREFGSAREASRTLKNELVSLEAAGQGNTEMAKELRSEYYKLESAMNDATKSSKAMDAAMDAMQSFTAMASVGNGLKAFFGFDNNEIQQSIQRLVALQGVLKGIETIKKQMETGEGLGLAFKKSFVAIDSATNKLLVYNRALLGTGTSAKIAAVGINTLSKAAKALTSIGIVALINVAAMAIQKAVEAVTDWAKGNEDLVTSEQRLKHALDLTNDALERNLKLNQAKYEAGNISRQELLIENEEAYAKAIRDANKELEKRLELDSKNATFANAYNNSGAAGWKDFLENDAGVTTAGGFQTAPKTIEELKRRYDALNDAVEKNVGLVYKDAEGFERAHLTASDARDELNHIEQFMAGQLIGTLKEFDTTTEEGRNSLKQFVDGIMQSDDDLRKSILLRLPEIVSNEEGGLGDALSSLLGLVRNFVDSTNSEMDRLNFDKIVNGYINAANNIGKTTYQIQREGLLGEYNNLSFTNKLLSFGKLAKGLSAINKLEQDSISKVKKSGAKVGSTVRNVETEIAQIRVNAMREGFAKTLLELELEKNRRIKEAKKTGKLVQEQIEIIEQDYNSRVIEARREYNQRIIEEERQFYKELGDIQNQAERTYLQNLSSRNAQNRDEYISKYLKNKQYYDSGEQYSDVFIYDYNNAKYDEEAYHARLNARWKYYNAVKEATIKFNEQELDLERQNIKLDTQLQQEAEEERFKQLHDNLIKNYKEKDNAYTDFLEAYNNMSVQQQQQNEAKLIELRDESEKAWEDYWNNLERLKKAHENAMEEITKSGENSILEAEKRFREESQNAYTEYYANMQNEIGKVLQGVTSKISNSVRTDKWGFINYSSARKDLKELEETFKTTFDEIKFQKAELDMAFANGEISTEQYDKLTENLFALESQLMSYSNAAKEKLDYLLGDFIQSINRYLQEALQGVQTIMDAFAGYEDYQFDKEQKALDDLNDMLSKKLQEQEDIISEHSNNVNNIENELASARGDRRDHLIDQLNAEIEAQRAAERERRNIEKQQEEAEKEQDKLDKKRREAEYKRNLSSILIQTAVATANGLATQPFVPVGIAMGALATALGMVQYAFAKKQKPYANGGQLDGGVAQGARHRDGGIPVLGGKASIEGGEFITNRTTTSRNVELLEYINSKKKRINIDDMLEFYSNGQGAKRAITTVRTKFADGGVIPTLRSDLDINDRLIQSFEDYSNRPVQVAVVDIIDKTQQVREVQTMAGLKV